ncbi:somatic embryogenesis receptor kinase 1 [Vigna unguiculata]|uniref:non-specific serine/threonine protein kinase n=1 Tax=Vigna unguiculata TaxID=3917 RepID=A0A4D6NV00_VIGUN|nr:somatic embryogenesis receptor kinase 1 [Vigna unguiculata]
MASDSPPSSDNSSPPPPPPDNSSPPPPPDNSSPPPPPPDNSSPRPPSQDNSPPPPSSSDKKSPPPPSNSSPSTSPPPPPDKKSGNRRSPPPPHSGHQFSPPPPSKNRLSPPKSLSSRSSGDGGSQSLSTPIIIAIAAAAGILLLLLLMVIFAYGFHKNEYGYNSNKVEHVMHIPPHPNPHSQDPNLYPPHPHPLPVGSWSAPQGVSSDMSSASYSGPHGPVLPPPHPTVALGFNQSTFTYEELSAATGGFSQHNLLGQGGFGYVHKGVLPNGKEIAVKSLKATSGQGDREFQAEVEIISRVHHRHLVSLVGYCISQANKLLVYEFVPNNTLEYHLHRKVQPVMDWNTRLKIAIGSAKGLAYLHEDCHPRIIHRDIKGANILLENNFEAKVADFGLAKMSQDTNTHVSTRVMGTFGYLAPEYASSGKLTDKSDVFSFGIMLLELITGREPVDNTGEYEDSLADWARPLCTKAMEDGIFEGLVDPRLQGNYDERQMSCMVACAAFSVRYSAKKRPKMSQIVRVLEGDVSVQVLGHEGTKPGQSTVFGGEGEYNAEKYGADMMKFRKLALQSGSEFSATSEYGMNPSTTSSEHSSAEYVNARRVGARMHTP